MGRSPRGGLRRKHGRGGGTALVRLAHRAPRPARARPYAHRTLNRPVLITVIGKTAKDPRGPVPEKALRMAEGVGRRIAERKGIVVTGGLSGVAEAVGRGAKYAGGLVGGMLAGFAKRDA